MQVIKRKPSLNTKRCALVIVSDGCSGLVHSGCWSAVMRLQVSGNSAVAEQRGECVFELPWEQEVHPG